VHFVAERKKASKVKAKRKPGRPKEKPGDKCDLVQIERLAGLGFTDKEIAGIIGIAERTITDWKKDAEFSAVLKRGKAVKDSEVVQSLHKMAIGYKVCEKSFEAIKYGAGEAGQGKITKHQLVKTVIKNVQPNVTAAIFWLKNRQPDRWRDRPIEQDPDKIDDRARDAIVAAMDALTTPQ
jgi:hypothetical protein